MTPRRGNPFASAGRLLLAIAALLIFMFPVFWILMMSFKPSGEWTPTTGDIYWVPQNWTFDNYTRLFGVQDTSGIASFLVATPIDALPSIIHSLIAGIGGTVLALLAGVSTAYGISRFGGGGKEGSQNMGGVEAIWGGRQWSICCIGGHCWER